VQFAGSYYKGIRLLVFATCPATSCTEGNCCRPCIGSVKMLPQETRLTSRPQQTRVQEEETGDDGEYRVITSSIICTLQHILRQIQSMIWEIYIKF